MSTEAVQASRKGSVLAASATVPPGYKRSAVGAIPQDWEAKRLGDLATFKTGPFGSALHKADYIEGGIPLINPMHIVDGQLVPETDVSVSEQAARRLADFRLRVGDIVIGRRGDMGRCAVVLESHASWLCGTGSLIVRCSGEVNVAFLQRVLTTDRVIRAIEDASVGSTMVNLNQAALSGLQIQVPPVPEQCAIAEALSDVDGLLKALEALIAKKRAIKQAAMQELLTGKTRLSGFSAAWETRTLGEIGQCLIGLTYDPSSVTDYGLLVLRSSNIGAGGLQFDDSVFVDMVVPERIIVRKEDLLICVRNGSRPLIGKCAMIDSRAEGMTFGAFMAVFRSPYNRFVSYCFQSDVIKRQIHEHLGATINQITNKSLKSFRIPFPPLAEQTAITALLSDIDTEIVALERRLDKTRDIKQGVMQQLLAGRVRLVEPGPAEPPAC